VPRARPQQRARRRVGRVCLCLRRRLQSCIQTVVRSRDHASRPAGTTSRFATKPPRAHSASVCPPTPATREGQNSLRRGSGRVSC